MQQALPVTPAAATQELVVVGTVVGVGMAAGVGTVAGVGTWSGPVQREVVLCL